MHGQPIFRSVLHFKEVRIFRAEIIYFLQPKKGGRTKTKISEIQNKPSKDFILRDLSAIYCLVTLKKVFDECAYLFILMLMYVDKT